MDPVNSRRFSSKGLHGKLDHGVVDHVAAEPLAGPGQVELDSSSLIPDTLEEPGSTVSRLRVTLRRVYSRSVTQQGKVERLRDVEYERVQEVGMDGLGRSPARRGRGPGDPVPSPHLLLWRGLRSIAPRGLN